MHRPDPRAGIDRELPTVMSVDELTATLLSARRGDDAALTSFVQQTRPAVWRFVAHLVDPRAADDLTQDTFLRAVRALPEYRGDASARTWLLSIARRACMDELRSRTRQRRRDARLNGLRTEDTVPDIAPESDSAALLRTLDPDRRAAFVLTQLISLPYADAAEILSVPIGTIRSRVARARADLISQLEAPAGTERADQRRH
jgi:RNA polymerase sigma-70 factor (ECF subfamily)